MYVYSNLKDGWFRQIRIFIGVRDLDLTISANGFKIFIFTFYGLWLLTLDGEVRIKLAKLPKRSSNNTLSSQKLKKEIENQKISIWNSSPFYSASWQLIPWQIFSW